MIVTIDGPSGTGKSTVARDVAIKLGAVLIDSGAVYRSCAWALLSRNINIDSIEDVSSALSSICIETQLKDNTLSYFIDKVDISLKIRDDVVAEAASVIAQYPSVRLYVNNHLNGTKANNIIVAEGRDMGSVVFPQADYKFYLTATLEERVKRRAAEFGTNITDSTVAKTMKERDTRDEERAVDPLVCPKGAIIIDTTHIDRRGVAASILNVVKGKLSFTTRLRKYVQSGVYWIIVLIIRLLFSLFYTVTIEGSKNISKGSGIFAGNHVSYLDPPLIAYASNEQVKSLGKASLFKSSIIGRFLQFMGSSPLSSTSSVSSIKVACHQLITGSKLLIFPEGQRSSSQELLPFKGGAALLQRKSQAPIYPFYITGSDKAWPSKRKYPLPFKKITIRFGEPIVRNNMSDAEVTALLREKVAFLQSEK